MTTGRLLAGFALLWLIIGCILGFVLGASTPQYTQTITSRAGDNDLPGVVSALLERTNAVSPHSHWLCLSIVALVIALLIETKIIRVFCEPMGWVVLFMGVVMLTTISWYFHSLVLNITGDCLFLAMCVVWLLGIFLKPKEQNQ